MPCPGEWDKHRSSTGLWSDRRGAQFAEYLILVAVVAIGGLAALRAMSSQTESKVQTQGERIARMEGAPAGGESTDPGGTSTPGPGTDPGAVQEALAEIGSLLGSYSESNATRSGTIAIEIGPKGSYGPVSAGVGVRIEDIKIVVDPVPTAGLGSRVQLIARQTTTLYADGRVGTPTVLSIGGRLFSGVATTFLVTTSEQNAAKLASGELTISPFDPKSIPVGTSVMLRSEDYQGSLLEGTFRGLALATSHSTSEGLAVGVTRPDENTVRVVVGPTESVSNGMTLGVNLGVAGASFGTSNTLREESLRVVDFDLSTPEGRAAYQQMLLTGAIPARDPAAGVVRTGKTEVVDVTSTAGFEAHVGIGNVGVEVGGQSVRSNWTLTQTTFDDGSKEYLEQLLRPSSDEAVYVTERVDPQGNSSGVSVTYAYGDLDSASSSYIIDAFGYPSHQDGVPGSAVAVSFTPHQAEQLIAQAQGYAKSLDPKASPAEIQAQLENSASFGPGASHGFISEIALAKDSVGVANAFLNNSPGAVAEGLLSISYQTKKPIPGTLSSRPAN